MGKIRRTMVYFNKHNFNLLYTRFVPPHVEYENVVWNPFLRSDITLIENFQRRTTRYVQDTNKLEYQERLEALNLVTLQYRSFVLKRTKLLMNILNITALIICLK